MDEKISEFNKIQTFNEFDDYLLHNWWWSSTKQQTNTATLCFNLYELAECISTTFKLFWVAGLAGEF